MVNPPKKRKIIIKKNEEAHLELLLASIFLKTKDAKLCTAWYYHVVCIRISEYMFESVF